MLRARCHVHRRCGVPFPRWPAGDLSLQSFPGIGNAPSGGQSGTVAACASQTRVPALSQPVARVRAERECTAEKDRRNASIFNLLQSLVSGGVLRFPYLFAIHTMSLRAPYGFL